MCLACLPDIGVGYHTIVQVGFAIQKLDEASALETVQLFRTLGIMDEEFGDAWGRAEAESNGLSMPHVPATPPPVPVG